MFCVNKSINNHVHCFKHGRGVRLVVCPGIAVFVRGVGVHSVILLVHAGALNI